MASKRQLTTRYGLFVLIWLVTGLWWGLLSLGGSDIPEDFTRPVSIISLLLPGLLIVFEKWAWGWKWVRLLLEQPDLRGTWRGTLQSNYVDPETGEPDDAREAFFVVHQTWSTIQLRQLTGESASTTTAASLVDEPDGRHTVWGVYRNEPKIELRKGSPIHRGAIQLAVTGPSEDTLEGEYWTDRDTHGSMKFTLIARDRARDIDSARALAAGTG